MMLDFSEVRNKQQGPILGSSLAFGLMLERNSVTFTSGQRLQQALKVRNMSFHGKDPGPTPAAKRLLFARKFDPVDE